MRKSHLILLVVVLIFTLSCSLTRVLAPGGPSDDDPVSTWVAQTMAADSAPTENPLQTTESTPAPAGVDDVDQNAEAEIVQEPVKTEEPLENPPPAGFDTGLLRVVYALDGELRLWTQGAGEVTLFTGEPIADLLLSEDGWVVVFTTHDENFRFSGLYRVNADGSDLRQLLNGSALLSLSTEPTAIGVAPYQMQFTPGSRWLAFNTHLVFDGPGLFVQDDLHKLNTSTGEFTTLLEAGEGGAFSYSPDGSRIALASPTSLSLVNANGENYIPNLVDYPAIMTYSEYQYYPEIRWEPTGEAFWAVVPSEDPMAPDASMSVWRIPVDGGGPALRATHPFDLSLFTAGPVLSPDLTQTVYLKRSAPQANQWELHVADLNGSNDQNPITGNLRFVTWSSDGSALIIEQDNEFFIGNAAGNFQPLADIVPVMDVQWVDATHFLFTVGNYMSMQLFLGELGAPSLNISPSSGSYIPFNFSVGG